MPSQEQEKTTIAARVSGDEWLGRTIAGKYEVLHLLGKGGMSCVYKVKHAVLGKIYALKVMHRHLIADENSLVRFRQEATAVAALSHPNIITVHDCATEGDQPFQAMDYLEGRSLHDEIHKDGKLDPQRALEIFIQACSALAHAHEKGVIHRDLKPSNIMLIEKDGNKDFVKLVDFGIAKLLPQEGEVVQRLTQTGDVFGSPLYMSPEQCLGQKLDVRSDIYSMGCLMYETLTGKPPLVGAQVFATIQKHIEETPKPLTDDLASSKLITSLDAIIAKSLAKQPDQRQQTMRELLSELDAVKTGESSGFFKAAQRSAHVARIRMEPFIKRAPVRLGLAFLTTLVMLFIVVSYSYQMWTAQLGSVPPYKQLPWPDFEPEAAAWGTTDDEAPMLPLATIVYRGLKQRTENSQNAKDPKAAAAMTVHLIEPYARTGNYEFAATAADTLYTKLQELEAKDPKFDVLQVMPDRTRIDAAQTFTFIGDACYVHNEWRQAEYFFSKALYQLEHEADYLNKRLYMKMGDCKYHQGDFEGANRYFILAARLRPNSAYEPHDFVIKDGVFSSDRAAWMGKVGDVLDKMGDQKNAALAYAAAAKELSKEDVNGLCGQAFYRLAECQAKLQDNAAAEKSIAKSAEAFDESASSEAKANLPAVYKFWSALLKKDGHYLEAAQKERQATEAKATYGKKR